MSNLRVGIAGSHIEAIMAAYRSVGVTCAENPEITMQE